MRLDLHMHSTASDGAFAPADVVRLALDKQLDVIALTDHDNTDGVLPARRAAEGTPLTVIAGVELSAEDATRDTHLLGYLLDVTYTPFQASLAEMRDARVNRSEHIVAKLRALGVNISNERVREIAGDGAVGRPHIAKAMLEKGYVRSLQEAFDRYINNGGPAYVPRYQLAPERAIEWIHGAGGLAVLAHPGHYEDYEFALRSLAAQGLDGVEVFYPDHSPDLITRLTGLARELNLVTTGGSDFHRRDQDGNIRMGSVNVPVETLAQLQQRQTDVHRST